MVEAARSGRIVAFDYLRGFIVVLVVLHHSVLAYCRFGHFDRVHYLWSTAPIVDDARWSGFDLIVFFNDCYFMALLFLLSGLFVWPASRRAGTMAYVRARLWRLGLPFAVAVLTLMPLAYWPSFRMTGVDIGFASFWMTTVFSGPWPAGPAWFIAVLLGFDLAAVLAGAVLRRRNDSRLALPRPPACFGWLIVLSALAYLPALLLFGPVRWFTFGPFAVQASRVGLYGVYFLAGVVAGRLGLERFLTEIGEPLRRRWVAWSLLAVLAFAALLLLEIGRQRAWWVSPGLLTHGCLLLLFCAAATFAWLAIFLRFARRSIGWCDSLAACSYRIYLVHYPVVTWLQYALLDLAWGPIAKAAVVFATALSVSWCVTAAARRSVFVARVV